MHTCSFNYCKPIVRYFHNKLSFSNCFFFFKFQFLKCVVYLQQYCSKFLWVRYYLTHIKHNQHEHRLIFTIHGMIKAQESSEDLSCRQKSVCRSALVPFFSRTAVASYETLSSRSVLPVSPFARFPEPFFLRLKYR